MSPRPSRSSTGRRAADVGRRQHPRLRREHGCPRASACRRLARGAIEWRSSRRPAVGVAGRLRPHRHQPAGGQATDGSRRRLGHRRRLAGVARRLDPRSRPSDTQQSWGTSSVGTGSAATSSRTRTSQPWPWSTVPRSCRPTPTSPGSPRSAGRSTRGFVAPILSETTDFSRRSGIPPVAAVAERASWTVTTATTSVVSSQM